MIANTKANANTNKSTGRKSGNSSPEKSSHFGDLHRYSDAAYLRPATADEYAESRAAGFEGVILVGGVSCYVE